MLVLEDPKEEKPRQKKDDKKASPFLAGPDDRLETVEIEGSNAEVSKHLGKDGKPIDYTEGGKWAFEKANEDKSRRPKLVGLKSRAARPQDGQQLPNDEGDNINLPQEGNMGGNVQSEGEPGIGDEQRGIGEGTERDGKQSQETGSQQKPPQPEKNQAELDREEAARKAQEESDAQGGGPGIGQGAGPQGGGGDPSLVTIPSNAGGDDGAIEDDKDPGDDNWQGPGEDGAGGEWPGKDEESSQGEDKPDDGEDQPEGTDDEDNKPPIGDGAEPDEEEEEDKPDDDDDDKVTVKPAKDGYPPDGEYQRVAPLAINGDLYWVLRAVPCKKGKWVDEKPGYIDVPGKKQRILYYGEPFLRKLKNPPPCSKENPCQPGGHPRPRTFHHRRPVAQYQYVYGRK